jgi:hypothetical protein
MTSFERLGLNVGCRGELPIIHLRDELLEPARSRQPKRKWEQTID